MFRAVTVLCAIVVFSVIFEQVSCFGHHGWHGHQHHHRGHHHHHRGPPHHRTIFINVAIYEPKGLEVSTPKLNSTAQYFAFDLFINNPNGDTPDVSHNTSDVTYGKFIVSDTEVIIKPGDFVNLTAYMGFSDGGVLRTIDVFPVYRHMIKNNCTCANATGRENPTKTPTHWIPPWVRTTASPPPIVTTWRPTPPPTVETSNTRAESTEQYEYEDDEFDEQFDCVIDPATNLCSDGMDLRKNSKSRRRSRKLVKEPANDVDMSVFKDIFNALNEQCTSNLRTNYLTLPRRAYLTDVYTDLNVYVRRMLKNSLNLKRSVYTNVVSAKPSGSKIVFEMDSLFNKMLVLYHARKAGVVSVGDYDDERR